MELLNLNINEGFKVDGVDYVALTDLELEGYDEANKIYTYKIYARNRMENEKEIQKEYELKNDTYFEFKFSQKEKEYDGNVPKLTEDNIYKIIPLIPGDDENEKEQ